METGYEKPDKKACLWVNNITFKWIASFECGFFTQNLKGSKIATYLFLYA